MSDMDNHNKEEAIVDFSEDPIKPVEETLDSLNKLAESINNEQAEEMEKVKKLAEENREKIEAAVQLPENREDIDEKSIFVSQVDYNVTPQELMDYFGNCGGITRIKILTNKVGAPKGAAYIEFADPESVKSALMFNGNTFHNRKLVVEPKRKNIPRFKLMRGRGRGRGGFHRGTYRSFYPFLFNKHFTFHWVHWVH